MIYRVMKTRHSVTKSATMGIHSSHKPQLGNLLLSSLPLGYSYVALIAVVFLFVTWWSKQEIENSLENFLPDSYLSLSD